MKRILSLTLAVAMILGLMVPMTAFASDEITVTVNFDESLNQNQGKVITLPNLGEIKSIASSTGSVSHTVDGDNVTLNASGGAPSRSEQITVDTEGWLAETKTQSSQTFADTVTKVNAKGETVTLAKDGVPFVVSGSYSLNSKAINNFYIGDGWNHYDSNGILYHSTLFYSYHYSDAEGFSGLLPVTWDLHRWHYGDADEAIQYKGYINGTVYSSIYIDTRMWGQNYKVWTVIGREQSTQNYYSYLVDVTYSLNYSVELGAINNELDSMKQQIISRQADDRLNEFLARNQVLMQNLNAMPNEPDVNIVKRKSLQLDKAILIMKSIINMEKGSITEDVFNTSNVINQIEDPVLKLQLQSQLSKVSDVSSIVRAIQKAESTFATGDIKKAMAVVKQLDNEHPQKANLIAQIEAVRNVFNDALTVKQKEAIKKDAIYFVAQTEKFGSVFYLNRAKTLVEQLGAIDTALQGELQARLTSASGKVTSNSSFVESLAKRQLEMAEIHRHPALIAQAQNSISLIKNEIIRAEYMQKVEQLK